MKLCKLQHGNDDSKTKRFGFVRARARAHSNDFNNSTMKVGWCLCGDSDEQ